LAQCPWYHLRVIMKHQSSGLTEIYLLVRFEMPILILMTRSR
jgi:hypothetical protein